MIKVYQTKFGKPEGNCFPACLASILEIDIEEVPNSHEGEGKWYFDYKKWLSKYGLDLISMQDWKEEHKEWCPQVYAIVSGVSPRNLPHSTVYFGLDMVHDPHPDGGGVKDITEWIYIVPVLPKCNALKPKIDRPKIVCICGSTRFMDLHAVMKWNFEKQGAIVLSMTLLPSNYPGVQPDHQGEHEGVKDKMDELHLRKIDLADQVFVVNKDGYIGESTRNEINYAKKLGKHIGYLEPLRYPG